MKKIIIVVLLMSIVLVSCNAQKNDFVIPTNKSLELITPKQEENTCNNVNYNVKLSNIIEGSVFKDEYNPDIFMENSIEEMDLSKKHVTIGKKDEALLHAEKIKIWDGTIKNHYVSLDGSIDYFVNENNNEDFFDCFKKWSFTY